MAMNLPSSYDHMEDDYIDMEVTSFSSFLCHSKPSPSHPREFEFQMFATPLEKEPSTSPADELFYKGKLLPLHLPPRLQMVEKLLTNTSSPFDSRKEKFEEYYSTPAMTTAVATPTTTSTPFESCNVSPSGSCFVSRELNPEEYFFEEDSDDVNGFIEENTKKSWTKKLKLGSKLKASRAYLKSLFGKSGCSDDSCTSAAKVADEGTASKAKESLNKHVKAARKAPFGQIQKDKSLSAVLNVTSNNQKIKNEDNARLHRRSFSMAIKRHSPIKSSSSSLLSLSLPSSGCSSSSNSTNSIGFQSLPLLKRSTSVNSEIESPIQGAIAHCKQSQQMLRSRKTISEVGLYSFSASNISISEDQEGTEHCRG